MSEMAKTTTFLAVALVSLIAAWATRPSSADLDVQSLVGEDLTKGFADASEAKRLRIVEFDDASATLREFEVAEVDGLWTIPSKNGYPADAQRQMAEAATSLMDRKILAVASDSAGDHEEYGVIDPLSPKLEVGQKGVGTRVAVSNINTDPLVDLIIGKEVREAANQQHYVREANRDVVYVVELDPSRLSTDFENWIEKDLLELNSWDIQQVEIKDYSAELGLVMTQRGLMPQVAWDPRSEMTLRYSDTDAKWTPIELKRFDPSSESHVEFKLADDEEPNTEKLDGLKSALDELQIVDVARKPAGLSSDLKAGEDFLNNSDALRDLRSRGFAAVQSPSGGGQEIISSEGEVICTMNDGVEYVLRFGDLRMAGDSDKSQADSQVAADDDKAKADDKNVQRYLFAMVRFNEDAVKRPELAELPALPEGAQPEADSDASALDDSEAAENDEAAQDAAATVEEEEEEEEKVETAEAEEGSTTDDADDGSAVNEDEQAPDLEKIIAERKRLETANQRKLDEYKDQLDKGRQKVKDLNLRFGDWYFVVSNGTFQKIRLSREDVIKKKEQAEGGGESASAEGDSGAAVPGLPSIPGTE